MQEEIRGSVKLIYEKFHTFAATTGLKENPLKCQVYFMGVSSEEKQMILEYLGYEEGELLVRYLGLPFSTKKLTISQCKPSIDKVTARICTWMARTLSYAGRVQLIRSVLTGIQAYWAQAFILPEKVIKLLEAMCHNYLWSGTATVTRRPLVAWEKVYLPKSEGGLNLVFLQYRNTTAILKLLWALTEKKDRLWVMWIHTYYVKNNNIWHMQCPKQAVWLIQKIFTMRKFQHLFPDWKAFIHQNSFSIKKAYYVLRGNHAKVPWKSIICDNISPPKATFIAWIALWGKLRTKDLIRSWEVTTDMTCVLCSEQDETLEHLFFACKFSKQIWQEVLHWLNMHSSVTTWTKEWTWIAKKCKRKSRPALALKAAFYLVVYSIW